MDVNKSARDRIFQQSVAIIGVGVSAASLMDAPEERCEELVPQDFPICNIPLLYSFAVALIFGGLTGLAIRLWQRSR